MQTPRHTSRWVVVAGVLLVAAGLRLPSLSERPLHGDESLNTTKFNTLWTTGRYVYDPHEYHGPVLPYATLPFIAVGGVREYADMTEAHFRVVTAVCGVLLVGLTLCAAPVIGWGAAILAAVLTAISTAMVFYSRYYIHETPLVLFSWAAVLCGWRYGRKPSVGWAAACGASLALMHATKETALLAWGAMAAGLVVLWWTHGRRVKPTTRHFKHLAVALVAAATVNVTLFSAFFTHARGPLDSALAFLYYADRGTGGEPLHLHPWSWYFQRLLFHRESAYGPWFSEATVVAWAAVGVVGTAMSQFMCPLRHRQNPPHAMSVFLVVYTLALLAAYCIIPYKTPWCVLGFLHGMTLLAGIGFAWLWRVAAGGVAARAVLLLVFAAGATHLAWQTYRSNFTALRAHPHNPYVYAHPHAHIREIADRLEALASLSGKPDFKALVVHESKNLWPLPYYFRRVSGVGWRVEPPARYDEDVLIVLSDRSQEVHEQLGDRYAGPHTYGIRRGMVVAMFVEKSLWERFLESQQPER